jgi:hypothetical protein
VSDRIKLGSSVQVSHQTNRDRGYVKESRAMRQAGDTLTGVAIAEHDSHGLCYEVKFASGTVITYDREELEVVPATSCQECGAEYVHHEHPLKPGVIMMSTCKCEVLTAEEGST